MPEKRLISRGSPPRRRGSIGEETRRRCCAFTLVELLVVMAILAVLLGILMPSLTGTVEYARVVVCQAHVHKLQLGCMQFTQDHEEQQKSLHHIHLLFGWDSETFAYTLHLQSDEKITWRLFFYNIWWTLIEGMYRGDEDALLDSQSETSPHNG